MGLCICEIIMWDSKHKMAFNIWLERGWPRTFFMPSLTWCRAVVSTHRPLPFHATGEVSTDQLPSLLTVITQWPSWLRNVVKCLEDIWIKMLSPFRIHTNDLGPTVLCFYCTDIQDQHTITWKIQGQTDLTFVPAGVVNRTMLTPQCGSQAILVTHTQPENILYNCYKLFMGQHRLTQMFKCDDNVTHIYQ